MSIDERQTIVEINLQNPIRHALFQEGDIYIRHTLSYCLDHVVNQLEGRINHKLEL